MTDFEPRQFADGQNEASVVAALAQQALTPVARVINTTAGKSILIRDANGDERLLNLEREARAELEPGRIVQAVTLETQASLEAYVGRYTAARSMLFASIAENTILAVLDYHAPADQDLAGSRLDGDDDRSHGYGAHTANLKLPYSLEWQTWTAKDGAMMDQLSFVQFLEENVEDIASPAAADVLDACRDLQALRKVDFRSVVREDSDNVRVEYAEDADVKGRNESLTLPREFILSLPVYFGGEELNVHALLRWSLSNDGVLRLGYRLKRAERIRQAEFQRIAGEVAEATGTPVVYGKRG